MDSPQEVTISVALVTCNLPDYLDRCLDSIRSQSVQPYEIIVSDDSSPDIAPKNEVIALKWDCQYIKGPRRGLQANLNNAAVDCRGTHVRIVNDDHIFPENHFGVIYDTVKSDPESVWILGEYYEYPNPHSHLHLPGEVQPRGFHKPITNFDDCFAISGGSAIIPRKIFDTHLFLEAFGYVCDLEFGPRLKALGYRIRYTPNTYVIHLPTDDSKRSARYEYLIHKGSFLLAYLTYACYLKDKIKEIECLLYFFSRSILTSIKIKDYQFGIMDFVNVLNKGIMYKQLFEDGRYSEII
ncbi:glycosyltransferase family 2 protein [Roseofilum capinflatum]|uniref:Glycosyltransferase n=1 Tax=Roseofilum capinflatum BLCC-M114 TaxID=3022440 RepID=A0ABT7B8G6_9CYAN|nr:glycosyltransferase [Roseofilum capinflatum]MDJ1175400.1 glycosyltransferase [Roseofilum capinflatum BLCC-M114]